MMFFRKLYWKLLWPFPSCQCFDFWEIDHGRQARTLHAEEQDTSCKAWKRVLGTFRLRRGPGSELGAAQGFLNRGDLQKERRRRVGQVGHHRARLEAVLLVEG